MEPEVSTAITIAMPSRRTRECSSPMRGPANAIAKAMTPVTIIASGNHAKRIRQV